MQRSTPLDVIACVFALIESMRDIGLAFGSLMVPLLVHFGGATAAFIGMAMPGPIVVLLTARRLRSCDASASIPIVEMGLLRNLDVFAGLPQAALETLAHEARYLTVERGTRVITEGDVGDCYYVIVNGEMSVHHGDVELARHGFQAGVRRDRAAVRQAAHGKRDGAHAELPAATSTATRS